MRLQAFLARSGAAPSRRKAEAFITDGRVRVNGRTATLGEGVEPGTDRVLLDGRPVELPSAHAYLALNKPAGYLTTLHDDRGRPTVASLMPEGVPGLVPVGRLDADTTGLLLLTNDGNLANRVAHPSSEIEKEYELTIKNPVAQGSLEALAEGPTLEDGKMLPPRISDPRRTCEHTTLNVTIHEGRNRIIRRACDAVGLRLLRLRRVRVGPVRLGGLREGRHRPVTREELKGLRGGA
ncbi:pseudouridine synthase [Rubrobacter marinus]|uniref:Pseudouridine synthase n=1 Tax=Rubrobacter marinus TaxID=2653852 RepID=A0A6G8PXK4_9ACTN|nr:pseudouridine synthase [Rubrobacter marinus]QIN78898.1 pseudouridine synthase [Rubrobacter marinus]